MASFFDIDSSSQIDNTQLNYTYNELTITDSTDISEVTGNDGLYYLNILCTPSKTQGFNLFGKTLTPPNYYINKIYLFNLLHNNITGLTTEPTAMKGEIVIEHVAPSTRAKVYTCFFIQSLNSNNGNPNDIDNLVKMHKSGGSINSTKIFSDNSKTLPEEKNYFMYTDPTKGSTIIIYLTPIMVQTNTVSYFGELSSDCSTLFSISPPNNYTTQAVTNSKDIFIDCNPVDASPEDIQTYSLTLQKGGLFDLKGQDDLIKSLMNLTFFTLSLIVTWFVAPNLYHTAVIRNVTKDDFKKIRTIDILLIVWAGFFIIYTISTGVAVQNMYLTISGMIFSVMCAFSYSLIQMNKNSTEWMSPHRLTPENVNPGPKFTDFLMLFTNTFQFIVFDIKGAAVIYWVLNIIVLVIGICIYYLINKETDTSNFGSWMSAMFFFINPAIALAARLSIK
jgi:hypothetical protein